MLIHANSDQLKFPPRTKTLEAYKFKSKTSLPVAGADEEGKEPNSSASRGSRASWMAEEAMRKQANLEQELQPLP